METKQLKLLLKLLGIEGYHASIGEVKPTSKTSITECNRISSKLRDQGLVYLTEKIEKVKLTSSGKALLKLDPSELPITDKELKILNGCKSGSIKPTQFKISPAKERDRLINSLVDRGFLEVAQAKPEKISLNETGKKFLLDEYSPHGNNSVLSLDMLNNYITFLRKHQSYTITNFKSEPTPKPKDKISDEEVLDWIKQLDQEYNTNNYLPIFHLREALQPPFSREELDQTLYRLERNKKIRTSSLVEPHKYSKQQINTGIPQEAAGPLFFISVR